MYNPVIIDRLEIIIQSIIMIDTRMKSVVCAADFNKDEFGVMLMDSIAMRLEQIGECMKKIEKLEDGFLLQKCNVDPTPIIRFRVFIAHHYEKTDYEIIYDICKEHLPWIKQKIESFLKN